ncbi:MAG: hypothetical protein R3E44_15535 [Paracoccaceae bacterium]
MALTDALVIAATVLAAAAGMRVARARPPARPVMTASVAAVLTAGLAAQLTFPELLTALRRNSGAVEDGEVWRLGTALVMQDGGLGGGIWNIVAFIAIGTLAERIFSRKGWAALVLAGAVAGESAGFFWAPIGAGNSIMVMGLGGGILVAALLKGDGPARLVGASGVAAMPVLLILHDLHGAALAAGAVLALFGPRTMINLPSP